MSTPTQASSVEPLKYPDDWHGDWTSIKGGNHLFYDVFVKRLASFYNCNRTLDMPITLDSSLKSLNQLFELCVNYIRDKYNFLVRLFIYFIIKN